MVEGHPRVVSTLDRRDHGPGAATPPPARGGPPPPMGEETLDSTWDRKLARGTVEPDFTLDLHGHTLDAAHGRLDQGLTQAKAMGARVVLLIAGKPRPADPADRGTRRGAIRAKVLDWLAAGPHGADIAAVRTAHRRHGGEGALYLVLRRRR
jgi:DNA-nicking Smr family endonuclease